MFLMTVGAEAPAVLHLSGASPPISALGGATASNVTSVGARRRHSCLSKFSG